MLKKVVHIFLGLVLATGVPSMAQVIEQSPAEGAVPANEQVSSIASTEVAQNPSEIEGELSYEELRRFARAFSMIKNQYVEPVSDKDLVEAAIQGMLQDLDPHSVYLNKEDMADLQEETDGEFGGLGIEIGEESGSVKVIAPIEGTPAARAGILAGDLILKIDGADVKDKPVNEVVKLLRGDAGTQVVLTIKRASADSDLDVTITRELIKVQSVRSKMIEDTAYFRISQFQANTVGDLAVQIRRISERYTPNSIVLDLRNDPGGLLNVAVGVVQAFSNSNQVIVSTKARDQLVEEFSDYVVENLSYGTNPLRNMPKWTHEAPMVVLINVGSASASEIVAGALQDFKRATVMGNRSFGKGSVQVVLPLDEDTGVKVTTARYYTPLGRSIQATGIMPDIVVSDTEKGDLFSFSREADLADHLANENEPKAEAQRPNDAARPGPDDVFEFGSEQDFQLRQALNHLRGLPVNQGVISQSAKVTEEAKSGDTDTNAGTAVAPSAPVGTTAPAEAAVPAADTPAVGTPDTSKPATGMPTSDMPASETSASETPAADAPATAPPATGAPAVDTPPVEPPVPVTPSVDKPNTDKPAPLLEPRPNRTS